ncbi:MAG: PD-(D/E)XK nuclease family protein, partial [Paludibacter sp.]|nr:PD-(D/E)XK nuclease family protein [Paludibacter sp.]
MQTFLQRIAQKYFENYNSDIQRFTFVFPNRRAGVFFQKYLSELTDKPIFAPVIQTITDFFLSASPLMLADRLGNLFLLYQIFKRHSKNAESFDDFIFWGEVILSDFEEVDKFLVNPKQLFTNVADLKDLDNWLDALTDEQKEVIQRFWANFDPIKSEKGEEFVAMWKILLPIYEDFRAELLAANSATEAMIQRDVVERLQKGEIAEMLDNQYVFVGFNALTACEKQAFLELKKRNRADFYFDYEADELQDADNPASLFFHENKQLFPSKFDIGNECIALNDKDLEYISVPSSVGQAKQIYEILQQLTATEKSQADSLKTAIVLPDENLLIPLLHSFPPEIQQINVTMGFPLKATPAFALFEHVFGLHKRARVAKDGKTSFYYKDVLNILNHRYISENPDCLLLEIKQKITAENLIYIDAKFFENNDFLAQIFQNQSDTKTFIAYLLNIITNIHKAWKTNENADFQLDSDFLYHYYLAFNRIAVILKKNTYNVDFQLDTLIQIIKQFTQGISIPFEGEPLAGLQVMGVLETRLLDFENVIVSSFSEGIFPKRNPPDSFIPQNLRKGFGLPTTDRQDAVSSYNFYRLIARAKRV